MAMIPRIAGPKAIRAPAIMAAISASERELLRAVQGKIPLRRLPGHADSSAR